MTDSDIERACALLIEAHRHGRRFAAQAQPGPSGPSDVYRIHAGVVGALAPGVRIDTWKVSPPRGDMPATASPVLPGCRLVSPAQVRATGLLLLGIEAELAFRFAADLPPRASPYPDGEVLAAVDRILVAIELCDTRLADWEQAPPLWRLADLQSGAWLVVGEGRREWRGIDFVHQEVELSINGQVRVRERGTHPTVDPSRLLPAIAAHCARHADGLRAGDTVTTGSWTGMTRAAPGDLVRVQFFGIGTAELALSN